MPPSSPKKSPLGTTLVLPCSWTLLDRPRSRYRIMMIMSRGTKMSRKFKNCNLLFMFFFVFVFFWKVYTLQFLGYWDDIFHDLSWDIYAYVGSCWIRPRRDAPLLISDRFNYGLMVVKLEIWSPDEPARVFRSEQHENIWMFRAVSISETTRLDPFPDGNPVS